ncbi:MAG: S1 RNA-binding domain-containing protein [Clostridia bacterium]|nr:S1 RNA-binding domain-containing protein [Clostridia bacterium]
MSFEVGSIIDGKVSKVMPFGAFVSLPDRKSGLVHISEIARDYVENINDHLKEGDEVKVKVVKIDDDGKISLSIKQALEPKKRADKKSAEQAPKTRVRPADIDWGSSNNSSDLSFDDMLNRFKQDADEKMQALKRSNDSKRSGGYRRGGGSY